VSTRTRRPTPLSRSTATNNHSLGSISSLIGRRPSGCWRGRRRSLSGAGRWSPPRARQAAGPAAPCCREDVLDVPPTLSARVRLLGSTKAAKNGTNDVLSTATAGLRHCGLRAVRVDDHTSVIRILVDRYDDLTRLRTQAACRLHATLRDLVAGGAPRRLSADRAAKLVRSVRPVGVGRDRTQAPGGRAAGRPASQRPGATASSTTPCTWRRSPRSATPPRAGSTTSPNRGGEVQEGGAARPEAPHQRRRLAPTPSRPPPPLTTRAREDNQGRLFNPAWPAGPWNTTLEQVTPGPDHHATPAPTALLRRAPRQPLDTKRLRSRAASFCRKGNRWPAFGRQAHGDSLAPRHLRRPSDGHSGVVTDPPAG
jgi:hypothetical protein